MRSLPLLCLLLGSAAATEPPGPEIHQRAARIAGAVLVDGHALKILEELSDRIGGRLTASPSYARAIEWGQAQLRAAGVTAVRLEPFTLEHGWLRGAARARVVAPFDRTLHVESMGWAPATPKGGVRGPLAVVHDFSPEALAPELPRLRGAIVLVDPRRAPGRSYKIWLGQTRAREQLRDAGALALLVMPADVMSNVVGTFAPSWGGKLAPLPMATLGREDGKLLVRAAERGPVTVELELTNRITGPATTASVVGELRGSERPDEWILVGAHLDSWDFATGSQDNGSGVAQVIEAARVLAATGPHKRSVRFALWGGEEQGMVGSMAYVQAHEAELAGCVAVLNTDNGAGHPKGWKTEARRDVAAALEPISRTLLVGLGGDAVELTRTFDTDHAFFMLRGVPVLDLLVDPGNYGLVHHLPSDTVDKVEEHDLASGAAVVAVTAEALADSTAPFAPHVDHAAVAEILKEDAMDEYLSYVGLWR
jgi:hypothetical protein